MALFIPGINRFRRDEGKKFVVTGCGRSGTLYMAKVLTALGWDVGHEGFMTDGISSWYIVEKTRAAKVLEMMHGLDCLYIHLVRNPLEVISSIMRCELIKTREALDFFARTHPQYNGVELIERCARYWVEWNKETSKRFPIDLRLRVDDMPQCLEELCTTWLQCELGPVAERSIIELGQDCHHIPQYARESLVKAHGEEVLRTISIEECGDVADDVRKWASAFHYNL